MLSLVMDKPSDIFAFGETLDADFLRHITASAVWVIVLTVVYGNRIMHQSLLMFM